MERGVEWRCVETGRGARGSIFVCFKDPEEPGLVVRARREDRTLGGLQVWWVQVEGRPRAGRSVYLKSRRELKDVLKRLLREWEEMGLL